mmetsp:Transcript_3454/g.4251  ORF Transcript_3454/g.4251 Transcript_3454/m.4251 type:complete len:82 (-) Transcript_3454:35-280(-)
MYLYILYPSIVAIKQITNNIITDIITNNDSLTFAFDVVFVGDIAVSLLDNIELTHKINTMEANKFFAISVFYNITLKCIII